MGRMTIDDIARLAKVSKTTVSRFINGRYESMSETTRRGIERIISEEHYYPSSAARRLKSGKSMLVGVMVSVTQNSTLLFQLIWGICEGLKANGYTPIIYDSTEEDEEKNLQACFGQDLEGLIFSPSTLNFPIYERAVALGMPIVLVDRYHEQWKYDAVYIDHYRAVTEAMRHLTEQGYEQIAFLCDDVGPVSTKMTRQRAYLDFLRSGRGGPREENVYRLRRYSEVKKALDTFMTKHPGARKAVFAADSDALLETLNVVTQSGMSMPHDVGVCGYDNWGWAKLVSPGITTLTQPTIEMGNKAVDRLLTRIGNPDQERRKPTRLKCRFDVRQSTLLSG